MAIPQAETTAIPVVTPDEIKMQAISLQCAKLKMQVQDLKNGFTKLEQICGTNGQAQEQGIDTLIGMTHQPFLNMMLTRIEQYWMDQFGCND